MSEAEWLACEEPDLMLEVVEGMITPQQLVDFVRSCWERVIPHLPSDLDSTVAEQFAALARQQSDHDAVLYAAEAALLAARWAPVLKEEQRHQAALLRRIVGRTFQSV